MSDIELFIGAIDLSPYFITITEAAFVFDNVPASIVTDLLRLAELDAPLRIPMYFSDAIRPFSLYSVWYDRRSSKLDYLHFNLHAPSGHLFQLAIKNKEPQWATNYSSGRWI